MNNNGQTTKGTLYLIATPIGNLGDMTYRGVELLKEVDLIACEDTRHTRKLLNHFEINTSTTSYHEHNKQAKGKYLIQTLLEGKNIGLVTDAGTPGISDPGEDLVRLCHDEKITVTSAPGAVAAITSLIISGFSTRYFAFEGFLPTDKKQLRRRLELLKDETRTLIIYEAPHRLKQTLKKLQENLGDRQVGITRELTKRHEEILRMTLSEALSHYESQDPRGEYVLILEGRDIKEMDKEEQESWNSYSLEEHMEIYLQQGIQKKEAMKKVAKDRGISKRDVYQAIEVDKK